MRLMVMLLAAASLAGCDVNAQPDQPAVEVKPAALTYDGAGAAVGAAMLGHGERMSAVLSCTGCHGANLQGKNVTPDEPGTGDMYAPNLTLLMASYSDAELDRAVRGGVAKDGRHLWFMPSETLQFLSDADFAALVAHLRTLKPAGKPQPPIRRGPQYLADVAKGLYTDAPGMAQRYRAAPPIELGPSHALGRYIAMTTCTACHNNALQGFGGFTPNLDIAGAYSAAELTTLLTTGEGKVKKDLGLMSEVAEHSLSRMTPRERDAVIAYIKARVDRPQ